MYPSVAASGSLVHVVCQDDRSGTEEIYYKRSGNGGASWSSDTRLTNNTAWSLRPSVAVSGSIMHIVWYDYRDRNAEIYYKRSQDGGSSWEADTRLTSNSSYSENPSVTISGSLVHVVWQDDRDGNYEIYYKHNPTGNTVGIETLVSEIPEQFGLGQNYPNPFNPVTTIRYNLPMALHDSITVYNILAQQVAILVDEIQEAGYKSVQWNASNFPSGVYMYRIKSPNFSQTKKLLLMK
jgi:hypothetical protein